MRQTQKEFGNNFNKIKNKMKKILIISFVIIFLSVSGTFAKETTINGKIVGKETFNEILLENLISGKIEARCKISKNGKFQLRINIEIANYYRLFLTDEIHVFYVPEPGENANIEINTKAVEKSIIRGSKHTLLYHNTLKKYKTNSQKKRKDIARELINNNPNSIVCVIFATDLDFDKDEIYFKKLIKGMDKYSENEHIKNFINRFERHKKLKIGAIAPEISLKNTKGSYVKLSSLKGNYVLIDFWASWCGPCRRESPNIVKIYNKYHSKGFEIYSVSLDKSDANWKKAITEDKLGKWTHVSDLKGWKSEGGKIYNVSSIPYTVLLDKKGKIIAKDLRGNALEMELKKIFGE